MKIIKLSMVVIAISSLGYAVIMPIEGLSKSDITVSSPQSTQALLIKKWLLSHYELFGMDFDPEEVEKNDYIQFLEDKTYKSISEGIFEKGNYRLEGSKIILSNTIEKGELKLVIKKLTETKLEVKIDDPSDSDAKYLTIHFKK